MTDTIDIAPHPVLIAALDGKTPVMIRLADALSPKGEWAGPFLFGRRFPEDSWAQRWKHTRNFADWDPAAPHARRFVDAMTVADFQTTILKKDLPDD